MRITKRSTTAVLGASIAAIAISTAPTAGAATVGTGGQQSCAASGSGTVCQSPGNVQINDAPPAASFYPYGGNAFLLGGGGFVGAQAIHGGDAGGHR